MRHSCRALSVRALCLLLALPVRAHAQGAVLVKPTLVHIEIPVGRSIDGLWRWDDRETWDMRVDYRWFAVFGGDTAYAIGFTHYKRAGAEPHQGTFNELLRAGQANLAQVTGHLERVLIRVRPQVSGQDSLLVLELRDSVVIALVFAGRPRQATLEMLSPYQPLARRIVPVQYDGF
jgi:hypothetical protein